MTLNDYISQVNSIKANRKVDDTVDINCMINFYKRNFLSLISNAFVYRGQPEYMDMGAYDMMLLVLSECITVEKDEKIYHLPSPYQYDVDEYSNLPYYTRWNKAGVMNIGIDYNKDDLRINENCVISRNTSTNADAYSLISTMAVILAHIDKSIESMLIWTRANGMFTVSNDKEKEEVNIFYENLRKGKYSATKKGENFMEQGIAYIPTTAGTSSTKVTDLITLKSNVMRSALRMLGLNMSKDKSEAVLSDETESDYQLPECSLDTMLNERKKNLELINKIFGTSIEVSINPKYLRKEESEVEKDNELSTFFDRGNSDTSDSSSDQSITS